MGVAVGSGVRVGVSVGVGDSVAVAVLVGVAVSAGVAVDVAVFVGVAEGVPGPGVGVSVPAGVGVAVGVSSAEGSGVSPAAGVFVGTLATVVGSPLASVGSGVSNSEGRIACIGVEVGVRGLGVLVGVGVAAGPLEHDPQAIVSQTRINKSKLARVPLHQPRRAPKKDVIPRTHPPQKSGACAGINVTKKEDLMFFSNVGVRGKSSAPHSIFVCASPQNARCDELVLFQ